MATKRSKSKNAKPRRARVDYVITVNADGNGNFTYTAPGIPDASSIQPVTGDTISWVATWNRIPVPFQIGFPGASPFGPAIRVIRSLGGRTSPQTVSVPNYYQGNLVMKYTVTLPNAWSDDPDVEPVPSDRSLLSTAAAQVIGLSIDNTGTLVVASGMQPFSKGIVTWAWTNQNQAEDFVVTFTPAVTGWPQQASSQAQKLALNLETAGSGQYMIQTVYSGLIATKQPLAVS